MSIIYTYILRPRIKAVEGENLSKQVVKKVDKLCPSSIGNNISI